MIDAHAATTSTRRSVVGRRGRRSSKRSMSLERVRGKGVEGEEWCGVSVQSARVKEEPGLEREHDSSSARACLKEDGGQTEYCANEECVRVKEEPGLRQDRGSSEACPRVKERYRECGVSAAAARAGLYAEHEVSGELVLGPERLQPPDSAFTLRSAPKNTELVARASSKAKEACIRSPRKGPRPRASRPALLPRRCSDSLERLRPDKQAHANSTILSTNTRQFSQDTDIIHERIHTGEKPYKCDICMKQFIQKFTLVERDMNESIRMRNYTNADFIRNSFHLNCI